MGKVILSHLKSLSLSSCFDQLWFFGSLAMGVSQIKRLLARLSLSWPKLSSCVSRLKPFLASISLVLVITPIFFMAIPASAQLNITQALCNGANNNVSTGANCTITPGEGKDQVQKLVNNVISIFSWVVGVVSVIMIIYGGFKYITSGGDSAGVTSAKNTIIFAIIGLVIVALSQVIVRFVIGTVTDVTTSTPSSSAPQ